MEIIVASAIVFMAIISEVAYEATRLIKTVESEKAMRIIENTKKELTQADIGAAMVTKEQQRDKTLHIAKETALAFVVTNSATKRTLKEEHATYDENGKSAIMAAERSEKTKGSHRWLRVDVPKRILKETTEWEFHEFCETVVKDSGYNWVTSMCGDGTGVQFIGSFAGAAEYGKVDENGKIDEPLGYISLKNGVYSYIDEQDAD